MSPVQVRRIPSDSGSGEEYFVPPEKRVRGNPKQTLWMHYTDDSGKFMTGIWHSEVGSWNILCTEEEFCQVLEGESVITDAGGTAATVVAGDEFVIPKGFAGTWEVVKPTRKRFVIYEPGTANPGESAGSSARRT